MLVKPEMQQQYEPWLCVLWFKAFTHTHTHSKAHTHTHQPCLRACSCLGTQASTHMHATPELPHECRRLRAGRCAAPAGEGLQGSACDRTQRDPGRQVPHVQDLRRHTLLPGCHFWGGAELRAHSAAAEPVQGPHHQRIRITVHSKDQKHKTRCTACSPGFCGQHSATAAFQQKPCTLSCGSQTSSHCHLSLCTPISSTWHPAGTLLSTVCCHNTPLQRPKQALSMK